MDSCVQLARCLQTLYALVNRYKPEVADTRQVQIMQKVIAFLFLTVFALHPAYADKLPIFDAHIHYSHDAVKLVPPQEAVKALRNAGLRKALVSSSDDNGTQLLVAAAPDLIVPSLRP